MRLLALTVLVVLSAPATARGATDYVYRLDGVEALSVHVEGAVAAVDFPSMSRAARTEQAGIPFRPQRLLYDVASQRWTMLDLDRKKLQSFTRDEMLAVKRRFLERYWESIRTRYPDMPAEERAKFDKARAESLAHPAAVTTFEAPQGKRVTIAEYACEQLAYDNDGKPRGTACVVLPAELEKRSHGATPRKEAEAVFGALAGLELFNVQPATAIFPGLVVELASEPGSNAHSLRLLRVRPSAAQPRLFDTTGFTPLVPQQ